MAGLPRAIIVASFLLASAVVASAWMVRAPRFTFRVAGDATVWIHDTQTGTICFAGVVSEGEFYRLCE